MSTDSILLSIIVVSYNTAQLTKQTIESVFTSLIAPEKWQPQMELLAVDNGSLDESLMTLKQLAKLHPEIKIINNRANLGFAKANNLAAQQARGQYLLLLNSDTIVQPGALEKLVSGAERHHLAIAVPTLLNPDQTYQAQGGDLPGIIALLNHFWLFDDLPLLGKYLPSTQKTGQNFANLSIPDQDEVTRTTCLPMGWVGGTAMLVDQKWWQKIGGLDEQIFMYGEDVEICFRLRHLGGLVGIIREAQVVHLGSASSSSKNALIGEIKNYLYFFTKHRPAWQLPIVKFIIKVGIYLRLVIFSFIKKDLSKIEAYQAALKIMQ